VCKVGRQHIGIKKEDKNRLTCNRNKNGGVVVVLDALHFIFAFFNIYTFFCDIYIFFLVCLIFASIAIAFLVHFRL